MQFYTQQQKPLPILKDHKNILKYYKKIDEQQPTLDQIMIKTDDDDYIKMKGFTLSEINIIKEDKKNYLKFLINQKYSPKDILTLKKSNQRKRIKTEKNDKRIQKELGLDESPQQS